MRHHKARRRRRSADAERIETGRHERKFLQIGRLAHQVIVIGEVGDSGPQNNNLMPVSRRRGTQGASTIFDRTVHIRSQSGGISPKRKILRNTLFVPQGISRLPRTSQTMILPASSRECSVRRVAGIAQNRQQRMRLGHRFRDEVVVLGGLQRHVDLPPSDPLPGPAIPAQLTTNSACTSPPAAGARRPRRLRP